MARPAPKAKPQESVLSDSTRDKYAWEKRRPELMPPAGSSIRAPFATCTRTPASTRIPSGSFSSAKYVMIRSICRRLTPFQVFNGWCKYQMSKRNLPFEDLRTDFNNGVVLCQLLVRPCRLDLS